MQVEAARRRLDASEAMAGRVTSLFEEGRRTRLDVERATLGAARARQKLLNAESDRDLSELELKRLIGWPGSAPLRLAGDPDSVIPELQQAENLTAALAADPALKALGREVELLGQSASLEAKRWLPVIEASAHYQRLAKFNNYDDYYLSFTPNSVAVGVSILLPLWTGGRFDDGKRQARARLDRAEADLRVRHGDVAMEVRRTEAAVARATAEKSLSRRARGIADQTRSAEEMLVREGRQRADGPRRERDGPGGLRRRDGPGEPRLGPRAGAAAVASGRARDGACSAPSRPARCRSGPETLARRRRGRRGQGVGGGAVGGEELGQHLVVVRLLAQPRVLAGEVGDGHVREPPARRRSRSARRPDAGRAGRRMLSIIGKSKCAEPELGGGRVGASVLVGADGDAELELLGFGVDAEDLEPEVARDAVDRRGPAR